MNDDKLNSSPGELWVEELQRDAHSTERFWKIQKLRKKWKNPSSQSHAITLVSIWLVCFWMPMGINLSLNSSKRESKPGQSQILWEFSSIILSKRKFLSFCLFSKMICSESRQRENCLSGLRLLFGLAIILISIFAIISFSKVFYALIPFGFLEGFCGLRSLTGGFDI